MTTTLIRRTKPYKHWEFLDKETSNRLRIVPERGGLITEWLCNGNQILYFDLDRFMIKNKSIRGGIPILFPICGDLPLNCLTLPQGDFFMKQHGFARDSKWDIRLLENEKTFCLTLYDNSETRRVFPYSFCLSIFVTISINALHFKIKIKNLSKEKMPFTFGLHPYFNVEDLNKIRIEGLPFNCINQIDSKEIETREQIENIPQGVDFLSEPSGSSSLIDLISGRRITLVNKEPMNLNVVWSDPPRRMVCLEPWTSPRRSLITGERQLEINSFDSKQLESTLICS